MAEGRHLSVLAVPKNDPHVRPLRVSKFVLSLCCFAALLVVAGISFSIRMSLDAVRIRGKASHLEKENNVLRRKLFDLSQLVTDLRSSLEENVQFEKKARLAAGLEPIGDEERMMGVGGPEIGVSDDLSILDPETSRAVAGFSSQLDELKRQAELQKRSYSEILDHLSSQKDLLEHIPSICPVAGATMSSGFGMRPDPFTGLMSFHQGLDLCTPRGTPVRAAAAGRVSFAGADGEYGLTIAIDHGHGVVTRYSHNEKLLVGVGQTVGRGRVISFVGTTGRTTGPHLHYEVRVNGQPVNPMRYILSEDRIVD